MKKHSFTAFDAADYLKNERDIVAYLEAASEDADPQVLVAAMGDVVRARNLSKIARDSGLTREGIYKAFSPGGNPSFATVVKVAKALELHVSVRARAPARPAGQGAKRRAAAPRGSTGPTRRKSAVA